MTPGGGFNVPGEKFNTALTPTATTWSSTGCADSAGTAITAMSIAVALDDLLQLPEIEDWDAAPGLVADLGVSDVEQRDDLEPLPAEAGIVGKRQSEVAGAHHRDPELAVEAENLAQVTLEVLDVIADASDAKLAEIRQILADLRRVQVKLLGQRLGRNGVDAGRFELSQAAQIDRKTVGRQLGDLLVAGLPLVR